MRCGVRTRSGLPGCQGKRSLRAPEGSGAWVGGCAYGVPVYAWGGQGRTAFVPAGPANPFTCGLSPTLIKRPPRRLPAYWQLLAPCAR